MAVALQQPSLVPSLGGKKLDLEMIYEEEDQVMDELDGQNDQLEHHQVLMMKRSRSLPQEEFVYLSQKLKELDLIRRTDSVISGHSAR